MERARRPLDRRQAFDLGLGREHRRGSAQVFGHLGFESCDLANHSLDYVNDAMSAVDVDAQMTLDVGVGEVQVVDSAAPGDD